MNSQLFSRGLALLLFATPFVLIAQPKGDVTDIRVVRHMDKHPGSALLWEPYIAQW